MVVRYATEDDFTEALDLYAEVAREGTWIGAEHPVDRERVLKRWRKYLDNEREAFFVAELDGRIVGHANMKWVGASEVGMLVGSDHRRKGIGAALLTSCLAWARAAGVHKVELKVWPHNIAAVALYEKFGFEQEGYLTRHYRRQNGEIWDCIIMGLQLPGPGVEQAPAP